MTSASGKGLIRSLNRASTRSGKLRPSEARSGRLPEPSACDRCGAIFTRRSWRRGGDISRAFLARVHWTTCPACRDVGEAAGRGRLVIRGEYVATHEEEIRRRIANVERRASAQQPERRVSTIERRNGVLEVITTSQKLAHRLAHELKKAFRGRASYAWSDDGTLTAVWQRER
jgi:NMD protein affecting ribosome stability and mRNA decay